MSKDFAIIDLFAGPGGLGEGFSKAGRDEETSMKTHLSIEMDDHAIQTLRLRAFLRSFDRFPQEYYDAINSGVGLPDWAELYPNNWKVAVEEVRQRVLGSDGVFEELATELDQIRERHHGDTILIGGPPCQAYSLVGRSRNRGKAGYVPEDDSRHFLYREYVRILDRLRPAAFVMENVKGMLSSQINGGRIFSKVLDDLEAAGDGYRLLPLATSAPLDGSRASAKDFLIRSEDFGVPQARHRVIILGVRADLVQGLKLDGPLLGKLQKQMNVGNAIDGLSRLRSGLSRGDTPEAWKTTVVEQAMRIARTGDIPAEVRNIVQRISSATNLPEARSSREKTIAGDMPKHLLKWFDDERLGATLHHETRGHIPDDIGRYIFSSAFSSVHSRSPKLDEFPAFLLPAHKNRDSGHFSDRFRTQVSGRPSTTVTSHISKDGHYFIHPDPSQCRSLTVREAARLQTFPDNYLFCGSRTKQYHQVGNAVPPYLAWQIAKAVYKILR